MLQWTRFEPTNAEATVKYLNTELEAPFSPYKYRAIFFIFFSVCPNKKIMTWGFSPAIKIISASSVYFVLLCLLTHTYYNV